MPTSRRREDPDYGFPPARGGRGAPSMFPRKLFQILCETDQAVVGWDIDGKSFFIANLQEFVEGVMPMYYRHNKLTSFQRQLNLYGFKKRGRNEKSPGHYYHAFFQRDHPEILGGVRRSYPAGSSNNGKSEDDDGDAVAPPRSGEVTNNHEATRNGVANGDGDTAAELSQRDQTTTSPKRKAGVGGRAARKKPSMQQHQQQQQQQQQQLQGAERLTTTGGGGSDSIRYNKPPSSSDFSGVGGEVTRKEESGRGGGSDTSDRRPIPRPWFYSGTAPVAAATTRRARSGASSSADDGRNSWVSSGRGGIGGMGGGRGMGVMQSRSGAKSAGGGGAGESFTRRAHPYEVMDGRQWGIYRDQEDAYFGGRGGGDWYESEEAGFSKPNSRENACSTWNDTHHHHQQPQQQQPISGSREFYGRGRPRTMGASPSPSPSSSVAIGSERDSRRYRYVGEGAATAFAGGRRPSGAPPAHRAVPTNAMFPAQVLRHERFGGYSEQPNYPPPPPVFLPAHTHPEPNGPPLKPSRWRPVFNAATRASNSPVNGIGEWSAPAGGLAGGGDRAESEWNTAGLGRKGTIVGKIETAPKNTSKACAVVKTEDMAGGRGEEERGDGIAGAPPRGLNTAFAPSSYRTACGKFMNEDGDGDAEGETPERFRFAMPGARVAAERGAVGSRVRAMAAAT